MLHSESKSVSVSVESPMILSLSFFFRFLVLPVSSRLVVQSVLTRPTFFICSVSPPDVYQRKDFSATSHSHSYQSNVSTTVFFPPLYYLKAHGLHAESIMFDNVSGNPEQRRRGRLRQTVPFFSVFFFWQF